MTTPPTHASQKLRVLIVEDDAAIAKMVMLHLETVGLEGYYAKDGPSGLAAFEAIQPHLVLLDLMMPGMDGREVCAKIRETSTVPITVLTAVSGEAAELECFELGADEYIVKPFETRDLMVRIMAQLRRVYHYDQAEAVSAAAPQSQDNKRLNVTLPPNWAVCRDCGYLAQRIRFEGTEQSGDGPVVCPNCGKGNNIVFGL